MSLKITDLSDDMIHAVLDPFARHGLSFDIAFLYMRSYSWDKQISPAQMAFHAERDAACMARFKRLYGAIQPERCV